MSAARSIGCDAIDQLYETSSLVSWLPAWLARNHTEGRGPFPTASPSHDRRLRAPRALHMFHGYQRGPRVSAGAALQARRYPRRRPRRLDRAKLLRSLQIAVIGVVIARAK